MTTEELNPAMAAVAKAEDECRKLRAERDRLDGKIAAADMKARELKGELAAHLRALLPELEGSAGVPGEGGRARGLSPAILALLADGRSRSPAEISAELAPRGFAAGSISMALSTLARQGKVARPSRGVYGRKVSSEQ